MIDIVLGEDHADVADALATVLVDQGGHRVVAVERTASGVLAAVEDHTPDLCVLDRWFEDGDGFALLPALTRAAPRTGVVVITADPDRDAPRQALALGAHAFVHRTRGASALLGALDRVLDGETLVELPPRWSAASRSCPSSGRCMRTGVAAGSTMEG
jgi:two-component system nitrate/nitrite response regulator NarL